MGREWRPGEVAMVDWPNNLDGEFPAVRGHGLWRMLDWIEGSKRLDDKFLTDEWLAELDATFRPLVVIDPEDREQVERLRDALPLDWALSQPDDPMLGDESTDQIAAALREFANPKPPKPEEPTGLGAVVEAINDNHFVRVGAAGWVHVDDVGGNPCDWEDIAVVRVLSEGVPS